MDVSQMELNSKKVYKSVYGYYAAYNYEDGDGGVTQSLSYASEIITFSSTITKNLHNNTRNERIKKILGRRGFFYDESH